MTEFTDYNEYELPEPFNVNERNEWGRILNDALDQFDDDIILRGTLAERPSASVQDRLFLDRGSNTLYRDTGSNWEQFGAQLSIQDSQSTVEVNPGVLNFDKGFSVTNPSAATAEMDIDVSEFVGRGIEDDGSNNLRVDEDIAFNFTSQIDFASGVDIQGDVTDGAQVIWDSSAQEIPDSALGSIDNATLTNSSLDVLGGDGLKNGGNVSLGSSITLDIEPANFAGAMLSDDGSDNLTLDLGFGVENDGSDNLRLDEDVSATWTASHTFQAGLDSGGNIDLQNSNKVVNAPAPTDGNDLARKQYVDGVAQGLELKKSVDVASQANIDLSSATDPNPVDGYSIQDGDRVLLKEQTDQTENGIYVANTATDPTTWTRAPDFDEDSEVQNGTFTFVENGTQDGSSSFIVTSDDPITLGSTNIVWSQFASAGEITAGDGLTKTGQTIDIAPTDFAGSFLEDDGSDNLQVRIGRGLEDDGSGTIRFDEDESLNFTSDISFAGDIESTSANSAIEVGSSGSVADGGKVQLSSEVTPLGYAMIQDTANNESTLVYLAGAAGSVEILHDSGNGDNFSTVENQDGTTNVYYDSSNGQYEINNETGGAVTYSLQLLKA
jgi:hypothetical protein